MFYIVDNNEPIQIPDSFSYSSLDWIFNHKKCQYKKGKTKKRSLWIEQWERILFKIEVAGKFEIDR